MVIRNKRILTEVCHNDTDKMYHKLDEAIEPLNYDKFRVHVGGDFFSDEYFLAWCLIAQKYKDKIFYTYTKSLPYWVNHLDQVPENFIITASRGGTHDHLIDEYDLKNVQVYFHPDLAKQDGVEIDHDDSLALDPNVKKFGLLLHGSQEKNTNASKCIAQMRKEQIAFGYSRNK